MWGVYSSTSSNISGPNAANWANIVLRKLWSVNLNLVATNGANKLVSSLLPFFIPLSNADALFLLFVAFNADGN